MKNNIQLKQLQLKPFELKLIGFKKVGTCYEIECLNSSFYYNLKDANHRWYYRTKIGKVSNHINLDIECFEHLYRVLSLFKVKYYPYLRKDDSFEIAARPLIKYIAENHHPHTCAIVDGSTAQLWEGIKSIQVLDYIRD